MNGVVYILCAITSVASAYLLWRGAKGAGGRLLFWSAIFFAGMALNNIFLYVDLAVGDLADLRLAPNLIALASLSVLIYALVWETT